MVSRLEFWSISYPLGEVAKALIKEDFDQAVNLIDLLFLNIPELRSDYESCDPKMVEREYDFESYLLDRTRLEFPVDRCRYLWLAHKALSTVYGANHSLCFFCLNKLRQELSDDRNAKVDIDSAPLSR